MSKPPTIHDVARLSGVSIATVSRYFSGKHSAIAPDTLRRVRDAANSLGYTPSEIGRSLRLARSRVVVMIVPDGFNHFTSDVAASTEGALADLGLSMVLANTAEDSEKQDRLLADAESLRARAIILQGALDTPRLREMAERKSKLIFVNRRPAPGISAPYVGIDNFAAGLAVGRHFVERGYQDFVAIHGPRSYSGSMERLDGFIEGLGTGQPVLRFESPYTMEGGYRYGSLLLADRGRRYSVFCANDMIAYGLHRAAMERNLRVPEDLVICGFDDNRLNDWIAPWLTTVQVPALDYGPAIARLVNGSPPADSANGSTILPFKLEVRTSA